MTSILKRKCTFCRIEFPLNEHYFGRVKTPYFNGFVYRCNECSIIRDKKRQESKSHREYLRKYSRNYIANSANKLKLEARRLMTSAINSGKLIRCPCTICGNPKSEGHHPNYSKPLEVIWLCDKHHQGVHHDLVKV